MRKLYLIIIILGILYACTDKNFRPTISLDAINTANSKSYKGGNIVDDRIEMVRKSENLKINDYSNPNIKIKIFQEN